MTEANDEETMSKNTWEKACTIDGYVDSDDPDSVMAVWWIAYALRKPPPNTSIRLYLERAGFAVRRWRNSLAVNGEEVLKLKSDNNLGWMSDKELLNSSFELIIYARKTDSMQNCAAYLQSVERRLGTLWLRSNDKQPNDDIYDKALGVCIREGPRHLWCLNHQSYYSNAADECCERRLDLQRTAQHVLKTMEQQ